MDRRYNKGIYTNSYRNSLSISSLLSNNVAFRKLQQLLKSILTPKKTIPFATVSSVFLFNKFAHAETTFKDFIFQKKGILMADWSGEDKTTWLGIGEVVTNILTLIDWIKNIKQHIYNFSIDVFAFIFEMLMLIGLQVPTNIFNNSYTTNIILSFSLISISIIILLTIYESLVQMTSKVTNHKYTDFKKIIARLPIALGIAGFTPFLFQQGFKIINKLTKGITSLGGNLLSGSTLKEVISLNFVDVLGMILFDIVALGLIIPILLQAGRRFWDLFCLCAVSPLALTAWIFDRHRHMFDMWWNHIKKLSLIQLVIATFIVLMGVFIYAARFITDSWELKILIILGALFRIANPPNFVKSYTRNEKDVVDLLDSYKKTFTTMYNTVTFKNFKPLNYYRNQKQLNMTRKVLRRKHGIRYVDHLIK